MVKIADTLYTTLQEFRLNAFLAKLHAEDLLVPPRGLTVKDSILDAPNSFEYGINLFFTHIFQALVGCSDQAGLNRVANPCTILVHERFVI